MKFEQAWPLAHLLGEEIEAKLSKSLSAPEREASKFAEILKRIPAGMDPDGIFCGIGLAFANAAEKAELEERIKRREEKEKAKPKAEPDAFAKARDFAFSPGDGGAVHTTLDYETVVKEGFDGLRKRIAKAEKSATGERRATLEGMKIALGGLEELARRCGIENVPAKPASSFKEALQTIWLLNIGTAVSEGSGASISFGRFDQYLLELYEKELARGTTRNELKKLLESFFETIEDSGFFDAACALNIGGVDVAGRDLCNDLSRLVVEAAKSHGGAAPLLVVHVHDGLSDKDFDMLCDPKLARNGQPSFYGEEPCVKTLLKRGVSQEDARAWAINSCMGLTVPGKEWTDMWGSVLNMLVPLEMTLNDGRPFKGEFPLKLATRAKAKFESFDELFESYCQFADELIGLYVDESEKRRKARKPNPFVSALHDDCIARGKDRLFGGVRYRVCAMETMGLVDVADSLLAIKKLAFDSKKFTLGTLVEAAKTNFEGAEGLLREIKALPKYGNADREADALAAKLAKRVAKQVSARSNEGAVWTPSFHTLWAHVDNGAKTAASLDGRRAGEPLAKNVGVRPGAATKGHSSLTLSAATIEQTEFGGGQALDISIDAKMLKSVEGKRKLQALLRTYFKLGGLQVQINAISPEDLREAIEKPELAEKLFVRIGGFSMKFSWMSKDKQKDFLARFESGV